MSGILSRLGPLVVALAAAWPAGAAETLRDSLAGAYTNNAELKGARAGVRVTDEGVPQALAGYRPVVSASAGAQVSRPIGIGAGAAVGVSLSLLVEQPLFDGYRTPNGVRAAEASVLAARETLRNTEQNILLDAVAAFTDVVRDQAVLGLASQNAQFLAQEVTAARDRLNVGEGTQTEVQQANARQAAAQSSVAAAVAALVTSTVAYEQVVGYQPRNLIAAAPVDRLVPPSADAAVVAALQSNPAIKAAYFYVDIGLLNVKIAEGALLPTLSVSAGLSQNYALSPTPESLGAATIGGRLSIPLYSGGRTDSLVRTAKERLGQMEIQVDIARANVRALALSAYAQLQAARAQLAAAELQVAASQLALEGVTEERNVGQRTTLDVLNAQADVLDARTALVRAQRERVYSSYALLAAMGGLNAEKLGLNVVVYQPEQHYTAVRDLWGGLRTPDGR